MAVTEILRGPGSWNLQLSPEMPEEIWKGIEEFGHICIHVGRVNPKVSGDSLLKSSRYTGVLHGVSDQETARGIRGFGMAVWLGDADNKGYIRETPLVISGDSFQDTITALLPTPGPVIPGTIHNIAETWSGTFQFQTPLEEIDYVCQTKGAAWRVNGDGTLDAGYESDIFVVDPKVIVTRKSGNNFDRSAGFDLYMRSFSGSSSTERDREDFTTRVLLLAQGSDGSSATATADIAPDKNPFRDIHGNFVKLTRIVQESDTDPANAEARAQLQLNRFSGSRDALALSTAYYDIKGDAQVGDYLWVSDPEMELVDINNELIFQNKRLNPMKLRLTETTWPVVKGMSVLYRHYDGSWLDLTPYVLWESGETQLVVGGYNRAISSGGGGVFPVVPPETNTTIPGQTDWDLPFNQSMYQSPVTGESKSEVELKWFKPNNTDSTPMTDLAHYEIRYRTSGHPVIDVTIDDVAPYTLTELDTVEEPIQYDGTVDWQYAVAPSDTLRFRIQELTPSMPYEAQIRAVDNGRPANLGEWSDIIEFQTSRDILPPAVPAPPEIAANPMAVLMTHRLGRSDGGEFNLDRDMHHFELHSGPNEIFQTTVDTLIGKVIADWGMITGEIPVVASFQITTVGPQFYKVVAVDQSGNKSAPSAAVQQTADLIDNQYVRSLTVDKVTAGTISADWVIGSYIRTGRQGARVELSHEGIHGYNPAGQRLLDWQATTGKLKVIGRGGIEITDGALRVLNAAGDVIVELGECTDGRHGLQVYKDNGARVARIGELESAGGEGIEFVDDLGKLVRASTLAFGTRAATVLAAGATSSSVYSDLPGSLGPVTSVDVGTSGRVIVIVGSWILATSSPIANGSVSFDYLTSTGVTSPSTSVRSFAGPQEDNVSGSRAFLVEGLPAGNTTFAMKYRANTLGAPASVTFVDRHLIVIPF